MPTLLNVNEEKPLTITEYSQKFGVNEKTARRDFKKLISLEFVEKIASTKKAYFKAKNQSGLPEK